MTCHRWVRAAVALVSAGALTVTLPAAVAVVPADVTEVHSVESVESSGPTASSPQLPLVFVDHGSSDDIRFSLHGRDSTAFFGPSGIALRFPSPDAGHGVAPGLRLPVPTSATAPAPSVVSLEFVDSNRSVALTGRAPTDTVVSWFRGSPEEWRTGLSTYEEIAYDDLWPGIDLVLTSASGALKYAFVVAPGADPTRIQLAYRGVSGVRADAGGGLVVTTPEREFRDEPPTAYQDTTSGRVPVTAEFEVDPGASGYGFRLGRFDPTRPLVIDPVLPVYGGFIGGAGNERGLGIAVDSSGAAYLTGQTSTTVSGVEDAYVAKVSPDGTTLVYLGLIGGSGFDAGFDVVVDGSGSAYVTGATTSTQATFPVFIGPDLTFNGVADAWVAKVDAAGTALLYSGYIGGSGIDFAEGIAIDANLNVFLTGPAESSEATFPVIGGPDLTHNGGFDTFIAKMRANPAPRGDPPTSFVYAGYIGGEGDDIGVIPLPDDTLFTSGHLAIDGTGNAYVSGITDSTEATFPDGDGFGAVPGPDQTFNGQDDAYVAKVNAFGSGLVYAGYVGGIGIDHGFGMAVDSAGNAYLTGNTDSTEATFPVTIGPDLTYNGAIDGFVAKVNPPGTALVYAGYLGGTDGDQGLGLAVSPGGELTVIGHTHSADFPVVDGPDLTFNDATAETGDAFVTRIEVTPSDPVVTNNLVLSGFIGGADEDAAFWVRVDGAGNSYVVGDTASSEATFPDGDGFDAVPGFGQTHAGAFDAFVVKISAPVSSTTLSIGDASVVEGAPGTTRRIRFTLTLSAASSQTVTVTAATANGTAAAPGDFANATRTVTFQPGQTSLRFNVRVNGDAVVEPDETFFVNLSNPVNATIADGQAVGTIVNDD